MRKMLFILIFFLFILIQSTMLRILPQIEDYFLFPNLPLLLLVYVSLFAGAERGTIIGFLIGFFEDSLSSGLMGINSLVKTVLGFFLGISASKFVVSNRILQLSCIMIITIFNDLGRELLKIFLDISQIHGFGDIIQVFFLKSIPESLVNAFLAILIFPFFDRWKLVDSENNSD